MENVRTPHFVIERDFPHEPKKVFECFVDAETAKKWLFTSTETKMENRSFQFEPFEGGQWLANDPTVSGENEMGGEVKIFEPYHRISLTRRMRALPDHIDLITILFEPLPSGCKVIITHLRAPEFSHEGLLSQWALNFDRLDDCLSPS